MTKDDIDPLLHAVDAAEADAWGGQSFEEVAVKDGEVGKDEP